MTIEATFTYKGTERTYEIDASNLDRTVETPYWLESDTDSIPDGESLCDGPYFEININTKWDEESGACILLKDGYVEHYPNTEANEPDEFIEGGVKIEFSYAWNENPSDKSLIMWKTYALA